MDLRAPVAAGIVLLSCSYASATGRVLDGAPISLNKAQTWCIAPGGPLPNWDAPAHPECKMVWRTLLEKDGRILYSARYAWPSPVHSSEPLRVLTEVVYEGLPGGRLVKRLYAVQDDEAKVRLAPLRAVTVGGATILESQVCMAGTGECGRELATWTQGSVAAIEDHTVAEIRAQLPKGYDLKMNPVIDLAALSGAGKAWAKNDADCCPSAAIRFTLRLEAKELHVGELQFQRSGA
jgi:hypothetical protein